MTTTEKIEPTGLTPVQLQEVTNAFMDHAGFCKECLSIRDLGGSVVPFELYPGPKKLHDVIERQRAQGKPVRVVVLKTRRSFFTAGVCAEIFHDVAFYAGRKALIVADHYKPAALEAFDYLLQFQKTYKALRRHGRGLQLRALTQDTQMKLEWNHDRSVEVMSADTGEIRGGGRHWILGDEVAFWRNATITLTGLLNMVPKHPDTAVVIQSTANGVGGEFYDLCQKAMDPANESGWAFCFFGWLQHPPYRMPVEDPVKFQASLDNEERLLSSMHGASLEQLRWRRETIATECRGKVDIFHQEYPCTPEEAFLASGHPVFDHKDLARHPLIQGTSGELEITDERPIKRLLFTPADHGALTIFKRPEKGRMYVIGADPSKGIDVSLAKRGENPDFSAGFVSDLFTGEQVALYRERSRPMRFAEYLVLLGRFYNWAYIIPEANDPGFIDAILSENYPVELLFHRQRDPTDRRPPVPEEVGFLTTRLTRQWLVTAAEEAIRGMGIVIRSSVCLQECRTFVVKPDGKKEHQANCHDDTVIALALTAVGMRYAPRTPYAPDGAARQHKPGKYGGKRRLEDD